MNSLRILGAQSARSCIVDGHADTPEVMPSLLSVCPFIHVALDPGVCSSSRSDMEKIKRERRKEEKRLTGEPRWNQR